MSQDMNPIEHLWPWVLSILMEPCSLDVNNCGALCKRPLQLCLQAMYIVCMPRCQAACRRLSQPVEGPPATERSVAHNACTLWQ